MCPDPTNWTRSSSSNEEPGRILAKIHAAIPRRFLTTKDLESESLTSPLKNDDKMCETFDVDFGKKCDSICANPQEAGEFGGLNIKHLIDEVPDVWRGYTRPFKGKTDSDTAYPVSQGSDTKEQASTTLSAPPERMMGDEPFSPPVATLESEGTTEKQVKPDADVPAREQEKKTGREQPTEGKEGAQEEKKAKKVKELEEKTETLVKQVEEDEERVRKDIDAIVEDKNLVKKARIDSESEESTSDIQETINNKTEAETTDKKEKEERGSDTIEEGERRSETQTEPKKGADVLNEAQANLKEDTEQLKRDTEQLNQDVEKLDQTEKELTNEESEEEEGEQAGWFSGWR